MMKVRWLYRGRVVVTTERLARVLGMSRNEVRRDEVAGRLPAKRIPYQPIA